MNLTIILASTREGRKGPAVADWITRIAREKSRFTVDAVDLKELNLPFMDEPNHPSLQNYMFEHTKAWSRRISRSDAFVFVTCEYNHGMPATLKNAIDYLSKEWANKPVAFVGYGGISGGTRAIQQLKQVASALKMYVFDGVILPFFSKQIDSAGVFVPDHDNSLAVEKMYSDLFSLAVDLKALRG